MTRTERNLTVAVAVIVIQTITIIGMGLAVLGSHDSAFEESAYDKCMAGWRETIEQWNASTARLNEIKAGRNK